MKPIAIHYLTSILPAVQDAGKPCGYAVALYALKRSLELIAVPWTENATSGPELVKAVCEAVSGRALRPVRKLHGRVNWVIDLGANAFIHLNVLPRHACSACEGTRVMEGDMTAPEDSIRRETVACPECGND